MTEAVNDRRVGAAHRGTKPAEIVVQFFRYTLIGGLAFIVDFACLLALTELAHMHYLFGATVGFLLGLALNYWLATHWVFRFRRLSNPRVEFIIFGVIGILGLGLNNLCLYLMTESLMFDYRVSKLLTAALVLAFNFSVRRALLFSK